MSEEHPMPALVGRLQARALRVGGAALVVTLVVPALHTGARDWWPWACVTGIVLGGFAWWYVRRGRGNAAGAA